ncbi:MAG: hypothetical protein JWO38_6386 [Gemmataceae bacterium]|nr:hypothetical protein [Gemmataceae bacterium]
MADVIHWAAGLVPALRNTGTGTAALDLIESSMVARFNQFPDLPESHPDRHLTAREAVEILTSALPYHTVTIDKAKQLMETGAWKEPPPPAKPSAFLPPPPDGPAPQRASATAAPAPLEEIAGPCDHMNSEYPTVQLEPVATEPRSKVGRAKVGA